MSAANVGSEPASALAVVDDWLARNTDRLIAIRRDLHAHPELGWQERRTTAQLQAALQAAGLQSRVMSGGTGLICDIGDSPRLAIRADIDALPLDDTKSVPYRSTVPGVTHACGHDVHTTIVAGAALLAARLHGLGLLPAGLRVIFQPAEELMPGGALDVVAAGGLDGCTQILALHCDPTLDLGRVGLRVGPITAASDGVEVRLRGMGGHTARPHLTGDLVSALAEVVSQAPAALARRVDPRAGCAVVWGQINAGTTSNVIPSEGVARGTFRTLDEGVWQSAPVMLADIVRGIADAWGVEAELRHEPGVPPVVNTPEGVELYRRAIALMLEPGAEAPTEQSLGGEDFGWYLRRISGAMARLGVRVPGVVGGDLHQPGFDVDERCLAIGVRLLVGAALSSG